MLTIAPRVTAGPRKMTNEEKHVQILRISGYGVSKDAFGAGEIGLTTGAPADLPHVNDIVVFDHKPWHYAGEMLRPHPRVHIDYPETILHIARKRNQSAVWWSTEPFTITRIAPHSAKDGGGADHHDAKSDAKSPVDRPQYPFSKPLATVIEDDERRTTKIYVVRSTVPVEEADDKMFKITFTMEGEPEPIDPDMHCGDAPTP